MFGTMRSVPQGPGTRPPRRLTRWVLVPLFKRDHSDRPRNHAPRDIRHRTAPCAIQSLPAKGKIFAEGLCWICVRQQWLGFGRAQKSENPSETLKKGDIAFTTKTRFTHAHIFSDTLSNHSLIRGQTVGLCYRQEHYQKNTIFQIVFLCLV
jgi:hypothetical protein